MSLGGRENGKKRGREEKRKVERDRKGKRNSLVSLFFIRALISSLGLTLRISSKPNYIPKAPSMSTITLGAEIRTSKYELGGAADREKIVRTIAVPYLKMDSFL